MRLVMRRVYRAFPELDRFGDPQCERFVRATRRGLWARPSAALAMIATSLLMLGLFIPLGAWALSTRDRMSEGGLRGLLLAGAAAAWTIGIAGGPMSALLVRDVMLRRRLTRVLRARGTCAGCGYSLVGVPLSGATLVTCPECGQGCEVDPSLGELVTDDRGRTRFEPTPPAPVAPWFFTPARRRAAWRATKHALVVGVPLALAGVVVNELRLRAQAAAAARARPGVAGLNAFLLKYEPAGVAGEPDAWALLERARAQIAACDAAQAASREFLAPDGTALDPSFDLLGAKAPPEATQTDLSRRQRHEAEQAARRALRRYDEAGVFDALAAMAGSRRLVSPLPDDGSTGGPPLNVLRANWPRAETKILLARLHVAREENDPDSFARGVRTLLALGAMQRAQGTAITHVGGNATESAAWSRIIDVLGDAPGPPDARWGEALARSIEAAPAAPPLAHSLEGERLVALDWTGWFFSDPARARFGRFSPELLRRSRAGAITLDRPLGTFAGSRDELDHRIEWFKGASRRDPWQDVGTPPPPRRLLVAQTVRFLGRSLEWARSEEALRRAATTMIALERYRAAHGEYPDGLDALVPSLLARVPSDPWRDRPLAYRRLTPAERAGDASRPGYVLYSVGQDGVDDGGVPAKPSQRSTMLRGMRDGSRPGVDLILNSTD